MAQICVVGAGPAGSTFAARMAQLGHRVTLLERARFPRSHLGESLTPGVSPLLDVSGARSLVERAGFARVRRVHVKWNREPHIREDTQEQGLLVDRGEFDLLLLRHARQLGVRVMQPCRLTRYQAGGTIEVSSEQGRFQMGADFVADATGRCAHTRKMRRPTGRRTVALYRYWRGAGVPKEPRIEAGDDAWYWCVPLPDGSSNALVFIDAGRFRHAPTASVTQRYMALLGSSRMIDSCAEPVGPVCSADATPWLEQEPVSRSRICVGDAAVALDPISSSGVQKAIQTALAAAIVANTLLRRPESAEIAMRFYRASLQQTSERHALWSANHYRTVAMERENSFWQTRSIGAEADKALSNDGARIPSEAQNIRLVRSTLLDFVDTPCIEADFVVSRTAIRHPNLQVPVAYVDGREVAPLLQRMMHAATPLELAFLWSDRMPVRSGLAIAGWLVQHGILVKEGLRQPEAPR